MNNSIIRKPVSFADYQETQLLQASAINLGGFTVNQNYDPEMEDYRRMETVFWRLIAEGNKRKAVSPTVKKIVKDKRAKVGFVDRGDLSASPQNSMYDLRPNLDDPGQEVKALSSLLDFTHFARSMSNQQGMPYGDEVAENTDDMIKEIYRYLDMALFGGNAAARPLEFNGLQAQMLLPDHIIQIDTTSENPDSIWETVNLIVMRAATDREVLRRVTHIFTTGSAFVTLQREVERRILRWGEKEVVPGITVPSIMTGDGEKPIISSPYLDDLPNQTINGHPRDILRLYLLDMDCVEWHGVYPFGGANRFDPQIFDVTVYLSGMYLVQQRMCLMYGTPYLKNNALFRIDIVAPVGAAWNVIRT